MNSLIVVDTQKHLSTSQPARQLLDLGKKQNWPFVILGIAPMPKEIITLSAWEIVPAHLDNSHIPARALERIQAVYAAGVRPQGFVVVHERPIAAPELPVVAVESETRHITIDLGKIAEIGESVLKAAAVGVATVVGVTIPAILAVGSAVLLDPILVAVTEDNVWIEIDRWWD